MRTVVGVLSEGGASHAGIVIVFTNRGPTCTIRAYPGVDGLGSDGQPVVHAKRTPDGYLGGPGKSSDIRLDTGAVASALFEGLDGRARGGPPCPSYNEIAITPPNETHSVRRTSPMFCEPEIHPVAAGSKGGSS